MAQVHQVRNRRGELADMLGMSIGQGLGAMTNDYYATKAINKVMEDKSLENAPFEKRMGKLQEALRPFGERGQQALQNLFTIGQEGRKQRAEEKKAIQEAESQKAIDTYLESQGLPKGLPATAIAPLIKGQQNQKTFQEAANYIEKKNAGKGIAPQTPGTPQQPQATQERPMADWSDKDLFDAKALPNKIVNELADTELDYRKFQKTQKNEDRRYDFDVHKQTKDFDEKLDKEHSDARKERIALDQIEKDVRSGKLGPTSKVNIAQKHLKGTFLEHAFDSPESASFQSALPQLLGGFESIFKRGLTDRDLMLILDKLPNIGKSEEANLAGVEFLRKILDLNDKKYDIAQEIKRENKGLRPIDYTAEIERRYDEKYGKEAASLFTDATGKVKGKDPRGRPITIDKDQLEYYKGLGATFE